MYASAVGNTETVKVLLQHGASLDLTDVHVRSYVTSIIIVSLCVLCARMLGTSQSCNILHTFHCWYTSSQ